MFSIFSHFAIARDHMSTYGSPLIDIFNNGLLTSITVGITKLNDLNQAIARSVKDK